MNVRRDPIAFGNGIPAVDKNWKELLVNNEQAFLTDNQLSVFVDKQNPGCERIHYYPLPFPHKFEGSNWNFDELVNHDSLRSIGPSLDFVSENTELTFLPCAIEKRMVSGSSIIIEKSTVFGDTMIIEWDINGLDHTKCDFTLPYFGAEVESIKNGICASIKNEVFVALSFSGAADLRYETCSDQLSIESEITLDPEHKLTFALSCGYEKDAVINAALRAAEAPEAIFQSAEDMWNDYFTKIVPYFSCSNKDMERLYYYQAQVTRSNLYDIPYEPFTHPYVAPWKPGALWQWSWNTPMNSVCERWLNDKAIGAGGILLEGDNGGALNIGTYLHPLDKPTILRSNNDYHQEIGRLIKSLPEQYDLIPLTTIPHTTPNALLGAWEFYLCSGDKDFLQEVLSIMIEAEKQFSRYELESGLCTCTFVDEFDYSLRLKPFIKEFKKLDPEMMTKMDTPYIAIDFNCYLHAFREKMIQIAEILGVDNAGMVTLREKNLKLKESIQKYLWDDEDGFYYDADPRNMKRSNIKCIGAFSALYTGIADSDQADRMVEHLKNPKEFGTTYPCPSISMDTPDIDPTIPTYGGDSMITTGIWFTVEGLVRYGYNDLAAEYILKTIELLTLDGPRSSYSYNSITGDCNQKKHELASQSCIVTDLICKYIIGINPLMDGEFDANPIALKKSGITDFVFGPYDYCGKNVVVKMSAESGYEISVRQGQVWPEVLSD